MKIKLLLFAAVILISNKINYAQKYSEAIEDNSFFIEEAYNQEDRVVQHISTGSYTRQSKDFVYSFTQEWPAFGQKHQLSYTLLYSNLKSAGVSGIGDFMINYRYQLLEHDDWAAFSPRLSVIIPTGDDKKGLGNGVWGVQVNLPFSKRISEYFAAHFNLGVTIYPNMKTTNLNGEEKKITISNYFTGGSVIWLVNSNLNFMLEYLVNRFEAFDANAEKINTTQQIISPGIRYAINISELQIVPGIAVPVTVTKDNSNTDLFFYLSFEHPF